MKIDELAADSPVSHSDGVSGISSSSSSVDSDHSTQPFFAKTSHQHGRKGRKQSMPSRYQLLPSPNPFVSQACVKREINDEEDDADLGADVGYVSHSTASSSVSSRRDAAGIEDEDHKPEELTNSSRSSLASATSTPPPESPENGQITRTDQLAIFSSSSHRPNNGRRIFNADAYCHLCEKEFCNKYFLKTHKANKHGVYVDEVPDNLDSRLPICTDLPSSVPELGEIVSSKNSPDSTPNNHLPVSDNNAELQQQQFMQQQLSAFYMRNLMMQQIMQNGLPFFPPAFSPMFPVAPLPPMMDFITRRPDDITDARFKKDIPETPQKPTGIECHVCHKVLSSRNFLRKHLYKKHNIIAPTETDTSSLENASPMHGTPSTEQSILLPKKRRSAVKSAQKRETHILELTPGENNIAGRSNLHRLLQGLQTQDTQTSNLNCPQCPKEFTSAFFLHTHLQQQHCRPSPPKIEDPSVPLDLSFSTGQQAPPRHCLFSSTPPPPLPRASSPGNDQSKSRQLDPNSIDLDSCCMKCSREYCSKYFLRTHLHKVHNLSREEYLAEVSVNHPDVYQRFMANPATVAAEESGNGQHSQVSTQLPGSQPSRRNWCRYCQRDFCNKYFFRTHMHKMHGETVVQTSGRNGKKRANQAICDICGKGVCSKYFLKIHRRNAHGISEAPTSMITDVGILQPAGDVSMPKDGDKMDYSSEDDEPSSFSARLDDFKGEFKSESPTPQPTPLFHVLPTFLI